MDNNVTYTDHGDNQMDLLMRHSSPLVVRTGATSPAAERNSSPSPLRLSRPRSNPRNRTPMRYESPLNADAFRLREEDEEEAPATNEGRRITIRPMVGSAVGFTMATPRIREEPQQQRKPITKSRKQGPSHRKIRRWNNENFVSLATEIHRSGKQAAEVLLLGQADASKYRSVLDPDAHKSKVLAKFMDDEALRGIRDQFFEGGMVPKPKLSRDHKPTPRGPLTPEQMLNRIDARLRRVVVKACENSFPASKVVETLESFMFRAYKGKQDKTPSWDGILFEPPTVTHRKTDDSYVARFLFDGESPNGGFHRLLLHGLCQFHGLAATSSTMEVTPGENQEPISARLLTAVGTISGENVRLVNYIMQRKQQQQQQQAQSTTTTTTSNSELAAKVEIATTTLASLKV